MIFLEGVCVDRTAQGLTPRCVQAAPPAAAEVAEGFDTIRQRLIRHGRQRGSREADSEDVVRTGDAPARDEAPALARTRAASVQQRLAFGERAGQRGRRMGSGVGNAGEGSTLTGPRGVSVTGFSLQANTPVPAHRREQLERRWRSTARGAVALERLTVHADGDRLSPFPHPWSDGTTGITRSPLEWLEQRAALVPLPRPHLLRYGGGLAPHRPLRAALLPTPRQQGGEAPAGATASPHWTGAPWLKRVFAMAMAHCPVCQQGRLRLSAAIPDSSVIMHMLRPCSGRWTRRPLPPRRPPRWHGHAPARGALRGEVRLLLWGCGSRVALVPLCMHRLSRRACDTAEDDFPALSSMCVPQHRRTD